MDDLLFQQINGFAGKWPLLDALGVFFADYLFYFFVFFLVLFLLRNLLKNKKVIINALSALIFGRLIITELMHHFLPRLRPFVVQYANLLINHSSSASFPSGHAVFCFSAATAVFLHDKKIGTWFLIASVIISVSRVFVGVHWPADIFAGALIGIFSGIITNFGIALFHF